MPVRPKRTSLNKLRGILHTKHPIRATVITCYQAHYSACQSHKPTSKQVSQLSTEAQTFPAYFESPFIYHISSPVISRKYSVIAFTSTPKNRVYQPTTRGVSLSRDIVSSDATEQSNKTFSLHNEGFSSINYDAIYVFHVDWMCKI